MIKDKKASRDNRLAKIVGNQQAKQHAENNMQKTDNRIAKIGIANMKK